MCIRHSYESCERYQVVGRGRRCRGFKARDGVWVEGGDTLVGGPQKLMSMGAFGRGQKSRMCKVRSVLSMTQGSGEESWPRLATARKEGEREARNLRLGNQSWSLEQRGAR